MSSSPFNPVRRIVTGHNADGKATVASDSEIRSIVDKHGVSTNLLWANPSSPADLSHTVDYSGTNVPLVNTGSCFRVVDFPPKSTGLLHRTISLDYIVLIKGSVVLTLDDGSKTICNEGDVVVQQGTMHRWDNETDEWVRMIALLTVARPPVVGGKTLAEDTASMK
jgi:quercetin dioxygenase-like cupin family protein